ncbi:PaaI family thioesterase [Faunimonas sp. B44]|uniref:PaaI family thioesterase n=1 Tax=Faunimonas sp. B44 TaxID=3461493 RepID=UPI00404514E5
MQHGSVTAEDLRAAGWETIPEEGFLGHVGPLWQWTGADGPRFGFIAEPKHHNKRGVVQGGMLMTFADRSMALAGRAITGNMPQATIQLDIHFVSAVDIGEFVESRAEVVRRTSSLLFIRGTLSVGDRIVATGNGIWKVMRPERGKPAGAAGMQPAEP